MQCPLCDVELKLMERQGIEIDYCPQCRGVWLDRGELDKLIERSGPAASPYPRHTQHGEDRHHQEKRESFLGRLFDFD